MTFLCKLVFLFRQPHFNVDIHVSTAIRMLRITWLEINTRE